MLCIHMSEIFSSYTSNNKGQNAVVSLDKVPLVIQYGGEIMVSDVIIPTQVIRI